MSAALDGAPNFRDLGGLATEDGRKLRRGCLFRSQGLHALTDRDLETLRALDIRLVCDLRSEREREFNPSRWPAGMQTHHMALNVAADIRSGNQELLQMIRARPGAEGARGMMMANYAAYPNRFAKPLAQLFGYVTSCGMRGALPMLVHCSVGKDRTGFMIAILLSALGASRKTIYEDYLATGKHVDREYRIRITKQAIAALLDIQPDRSALEIIAGVEPAYLDAAFAAAAEQYGSVENYLRLACGLGEDAQRRFIECLTEP